MSPHLTFACELDRARLAELFAAEAVIEDLRALGARVALMLSDFSDDRAAVVRTLNAEGVPVVGVPLMPYQDGYFFTVENARRTAARYAAWKDWTARHGLVWAGIGLDIEPDARFFEQIMEDPWGLVGLLAARLRSAEQVGEARGLYTALIDRMRADGYRVENYQFPVIADERWARSTLLQRLLGVVDVETDREVWMLYTSFMRTVGPGMLWSYGPEAAAIAVGTTGGGPDVPGHPDMPALGWEDLARDLRLARRSAEEIYIHSLEGCVRQGLLPRLRAFDWESAAVPPASAAMAARCRRALRAGLWTGAHPWATLAVLGGSAWLIRRWRRRS